MGTLKDENPGFILTMQEGSKRRAGKEYEHIYSDTLIKINTEINRHGGSSHISISHQRV